MTPGPVVATLRKAIALHETHMEKPVTATMKSQTELMQLLKQALAQAGEGHGMDDTMEKKHRSMHGPSDDMKGTRGMVPGMRKGGM